MKLIPALYQLEIFQTLKDTPSPSDGFSSAALAVYEIAGEGTHLDPPFYVRCV